MKMKTRFIALSLAVMTLCANVSVFAESKVYNDVDEKSPYYDAVAYMNEIGVFTGVSDTEFAPDTNLTRGMFVTLLGRVYENLNGSEGAPVKTATETKFKDVAVGDYYCASVNWAQENGIVAGYSDEIFAPNDILTKQQAVTILHRFSKYAKDEFSSGENTNILSYEDFNSISQYAIPSIQWGLENGIITDDGKYINADKNVTRAQAAQYLYNYTEKWFNSRGDAEVTDTDTADTEVSAEK